jgi:hypothetical protein
MNVAELEEQLGLAVSDLRASIMELEDRIGKAALAERQYRMAKSTAYLATTGTVAEREAHAEGAINELRFNRDMAEGLKSSALEALRANKTILSAVQTLAALYREELGFARTGPA